MIPTNHLTEEQMYDLLDPTANASAQPHLLTCLECQAELTNLRSSLGLFRDAAAGFAASEAPRRLPVASPVATRFFSPKIWATSFATATALLAISISVLHPVHSGTVTTPAPVTTAAVAAPPTTAPPVSDEALLEGIQQDLSTSIPPSLEPLAVQTASSETKAQN
jgi:anti-sigma factor RsiW